MRFGFLKEQLTMYKQIETLEKIDYTYSYCFIMFRFQYFMNFTNKS